MKKLSTLILVFLFVSFLPAQGLLDELDSLEKPKKTFVTGTFKGVRIVNGQSIEMPGKGELLFMVQHRFGSVKGGFVELLGLDQANAIFGLEYTLPFYNGRICIGSFRSGYLKTYVGFIKWAIIKESRGPKSIPFALSAYASMGISSANFANPDRENYFSSRMWYCYQLHIAKKFGKWFSFQLSPTVIHKNLVPLREDQNTTVHIGFAGKIRISNRIAITAEYFLPVPGQNFADVNNVPIKGPLSFGVDWETGGHVFQFILSNSQSTYDQAYIAETTGDWLKGDIHFGFNIQRTFSFKKGAGKKYKIKPE